MFSVNFQDLQLNCHATSAPRWVPQAQTHVTIMHLIDVQCEFSGRAELSCYQCTALGLAAELSCYQCTALGSSGSDPCHNPSKHNMEAQPCTSQIMNDMKQNKMDMAKNYNITTMMEMMDETSGKMMPVCMKTVIMSDDRCRMLLSLSLGGMDGNIEFCGVCDKNACNGY
ncbi:hypothetical protein B566_EDAN013092 [Ephemera danica]|nr:hypothetical protein B566_EDAN013092 [Ephemera danica]